MYNLFKWFVGDLFSNTTSFEKCFLIGGVLMNIIVFYLTQSTLISLVSGIAGIIAVILCSQKKLSQFAWSYLQMGTYVYLAYKQRFYGELTENLFYALTMLYGMWVWYKHYDATTNEIIIRKMTIKQNIYVLVFTIFSIAMLTLYLARTNDTQPFMDSLSTIPAFIAQILLMLRYRENWIYWGIIDVASIIMWAIVGDWIMVSQFVFWTINCLYGYNKWQNKK